MNPIWVQYWAPDAPHGHLVLLSDGLVPLGEIYGDMEGCAEELAGAFYKCNEDRHQGKGRTHSQKEMQDAWQAAIFQLQNTDFELEWADLNRKIRIHQKWGGQVPAAILSFHPDDPKQETLMMPDKEGNPVLYKVNPKRRILKDIMDRPREGKNAWKHPTGLGWVRRDRREAR